ncbi:glyoxalase [Streptococcus hillyeri]|uniref:Glyoxalase n=1 Tax=Streptococcus hillyeri TaxID=2282420 RepID=A0A3L9DQD3_9STRE|nr:glyoxalase [Streptococcus hillyeri]RLY03125.1 glyoxalase [Streptococcus hillyeri]
MFSKNIGLQLYVDDVAVEKAFWSAAGFCIISESQMMGYETFEMKPAGDSSVLFTVYAKEFIRQVSPEVTELTPSLLFETANIEELQAKIANLTDNCSQINAEPFPNFNFASPSGIYFAVKGE